MTNMLIEHLERSRATDEFRAALRDFAETGRSGERIRFNSHSPRVKVERTLTKLLAEYDELPIESVELDATSGCEFFRGIATIRAADEERRVDFHWDCRWKAEQHGWTDYFGFPDQARAAREFGYDCFRSWTEHAPAQVL